MQSSSDGGGHVLLRAHASPESGTGHLMRCLALAQAWADVGGTASFMLADEARVFSRPLVREAIEVRPASPVTGSVEDGLATALLAESLQASWIVADGYDFGEAFQIAAGSRGARLLIIDDGATIGRYSCDLIVDHNADAQPARYANASSLPRLLLGSRFALLRREFRLSSSPGCEPSRRPLRLLLSLGGGDHRALIVKLLALIGHANTPLDTSVVIGATTERPPVREGTRVLVDVEDMAALMSRTDLAVAAGGTTAWELAAMGVPALLGRIADNQDAVVKALVRNGAAIDVGRFTGEFDRELGAVASDPARLSAMRDAGLQLVDRAGASAVVEEMLRA